MNIQTFKVKHYNSTKKVVVTVNQVPVTVTRTEEEASLLISYLNGYNVELHDSSVKNALDAAKKGVEEKELYRFNVPYPHSRLGYSTEVRRSAPRIRNALAIEVLIRGADGV